MLKPIGVVQAINAGLSLVLLDESFAPSWQPSEPDDAGEFSEGHAKKILEAVAPGFVLEFAVGTGRAIATMLEGGTGTADVYRAAADRIVFIEPAREWWDTSEANSDVVDEAFTELLEAAPAAKTEALGQLSLPAGRLVAFDMWDRLEGLAEANESLGDSQGGIAQFANEVCGQLIAVPAGTYRVQRFTLALAGSSTPMVAVHVARET